MMRIDVVSIFPEYLAPLRLSLIGKAIFAVAQRESKARSEK